MFSGEPEFPPPAPHASMRYVPVDGAVQFSIVGPDAVKTAVPTHVPATHVLFAQTFPHPPQFASSVCVFAQYAPASPAAGHDVSPAAHVSVQTPAAQFCPAGHAVPTVVPLHAPDAPQYWLLVFGLTQAPPQPISPVGHDSEQLLPLHASPPVHVLPHVPQFALSVPRSAQ